jgi:hypothetical protein
MSAVSFLFPPGIASLTGGGHSRPQREKRRSRAGTRGSPSGREQGFFGPVDGVQALRRRLRRVRGVRRHARPFLRRGDVGATGRSLRLLARADHGARVARGVGAATRYRRPPSGDSVPTLRTPVMSMLFSGRPSLRLASRTRKASSSSRPSERRRAAPEPWQFSCVDTTATLLVTLTRPRQPVDIGRAEDSKLSRRLDGFLRASRE